MTLSTSIRNSLACAVDAVRKFGYLYVIGGPVGLVHTLKLARIKRRMATVSEYIAREKEYNRQHLDALNYEMTQLVAAQRDTAISAAQFWNGCEKKAGVQP
jgi:hypothetical protein